MVKFKDSQEKYSRIQGTLVSQKSASQQNKTENRGQKQGRQPNKAGGMIRQVG